MATFSLSWVLRVVARCGDDLKDAEDLPAYPERFVGFCENLDTKPHDASTWLVLADWLQEEGELDLEYAARWIAKRVPKVKLLAPDARTTEWRVEGMPKVIEAYWKEDADQVYITKIEVLLAFVARALARYRADAE